MDENFKLHNEGSEHVKKSEFYRFFPIFFNSHTTGYSRPKTVEDLNVHGKTNTPTIGIQHFILSCMMACPVKLKTAESDGEREIDDVFTMLIHASHVFIYTVRYNLLSVSSNTVKSAHDGLSPTPFGFVK